MNLLPLTTLLIVSTAALPISLSQTRPTTNHRVGYNGNGMFSMIMSTASLPSLPSPPASGPTGARPLGTPEASDSNSTVTYTHYTGDGSVAAGWPDQKEWIDYDTMWTQNKAAFIDKQNNTPEDNDNLQAAIEGVSTKYDVDKRLILAVVIQESNGNVRVKTTQFAQGSNPGLMQTHNGLGSCAGLTICPDEMIVTMIEEGSATGSDGVNLKDLMDGCGASDVTKYYKAARKYNSGVNSIGPDGDLSAPGATASYASDIANRLMGYVGGQGGQ